MKELRQLILSIHIPHFVFESSLAGRLQRLSGVLCSGKVLIFKFKKC
ncbi:hypothetical protein [Phormidesmis priestleyi]